MNALRPAPDALVRRLVALVAIALINLAAPARAAEPAAPARRTVVSIEGRAFHVNGKPTYAGRTFNGMKVEGLLMNSRMVQGIFDDLNPETRDNWRYPDGSAFDAERNTREFVAAMPAWREHGLISFDINLQGGSPQGYSGKDQPWVNSAITPDGELRPEYMARLERILDSADELGMVPMLGLFYFGQQPKMKDTAAAIRAVDNATDWVLAKGYRNVLIEISNECNVGNYMDVLKPKRAHEMIERVKQRSAGKVDSPAKRLLVSTSYGGGAVPDDNVIAASDYVLLHGNGVTEPDRIRKIVDDVRRSNAYRGQPVVFNEDDHFDFDKPDNNMLAAVSRYAGWGYFDFRTKGEGFADGYQSVPVDWGINSERKHGFFRLLKRMTVADDK